MSESKHKESSNCNDCVSLREALVSAVEVIRAYGDSENWRKMSQRDPYDDLWWPKEDGSAKAEEWLEVNKELIGRLEAK